MRLLESTDPLTMDFSHRTNVALPGFETQTMELADNSSGHWQVFHELFLGNGHMEGQSIKMALSGTHIGSEWVLQYLAFHAEILPDDQVKYFEG